MSGNERTRLLAPVVALLAPLLYLSAAAAQPTPVTTTDAAPASGAEIDRSPARPLRLSEALDLARRNNRDLLAARERLKAARADVDRTLSLLLPRLAVQGRFTVNHPEVSLNLDQRQQAFNGLLQGAVLGDLSRQAGVMPGNLTTSLFAYCVGPAGSDPNREAVEGLCAQLRQMAQNPGRDLSQALSTQQINELLGSANVSALIVPRTQLDGTVSLTLPLIAPPAYAQLGSARRSYAAQQRQLQATEAQLLQSVAGAFFAAAGAEELVGARRHAIEVAQQTLRNARARLEAGVVNRVEVTRAELAVVQAQQRLLEAEDGRGSAYRVLATLIQLREPFRVAAEPGGEGLGGSDGELVAEALRGRPEVPALEAQARALELSALSAGLRWLPTVSAFGNVRLTNATGFAGRVDSYAAGLVLDWQVFDGLERDAQRQALLAQVREVRLKLRQLKDTIADEVQNARRQAQTKRAGLLAAQRSVQLAKETLELVRIQHDAGTATQLDLLLAQDQLIQAEVGLAQARFDLALADIGLTRLLGRPLR